MNERLRKLRKSLELTQQEFANQIGMKQNTIATYEIGRAKPSEPTLSHICKTFNVNTVWLHTGEGEMFVQRSEDEQIAAFVGEMLSEESHTFKRRLISMLAELRESDWKALERMVDKLKKD